MSKRGKRPGDEDEDGAPQTAENICRKCNGSGRFDGTPCPDCDGTGFVVTIVGDA